MCLNPGTSKIRGYSIACIGDEEGNQPNSTLKDLKFGKFVLDTAIAEMEGFGLDLARGTMPASINVNSLTWRKMLMAASEDAEVTKY
ncbi:hypothetical protein HBH56_213880 [Parastagonospora nodorum]|nr:hypothetical protein HBH56_213880 [Parastagonospora nodorum]KAH3923090.1 hypothetical protein HBH54_215550 [Parastagonospora nodorum]